MHGFGTSTILLGHCHQESHTSKSDVTERGSFFAPHLHLFNSSSIIFYKAFIASFCNVYLRVFGCINVSLMCFNAIWLSSSSVCYHLVLLRDRVHMYQ